MPCPNDESSEECYLRFRKIWFTPECDLPGNHADETWTPNINCGGNAIQIYRNGICAGPSTWLTYEFYEFKLDTGEICVQSPDYCLCGNETEGYRAASIVQCHSLP